MSDELYEGPCVAGCSRYHGGEVRHHKDCGHYPESLTKMYDDQKTRIEALEAENRKLATLVTAAETLRAAQRAYMADRGNDTLGKAVGTAATALDEALAQIKVENDENN